MKSELVKACRSCEVALEEAADREQAANHKAAAAEGKAERAAEELAAKVAELDGVTRMLADLTKEKEKVKLYPYSNVEQVGEFAYYMDYADAIRVAKRSGLKVGKCMDQ
ncbi:hypothetical protein OROHE_008047 [Orobanche hederae]